MKWTANETDIGKRLDVFVAECASLTRSAVQNYIEQGAVTVNGATKNKNYKMQQNDTITMEYPEPELPNAAPEEIPLTVVYEDTALLVVNKPKGMVVHPAIGNPNGTLVNALLYHCGDSLSGINGVLRPGIVHRIDKDTSGLLIVAKTNAAHVGLAAQIQVHSFTRLYEAIVLGTLKEDIGTIHAPIGRHPVDRKKMAVIAGGRDAITHYTVLERLDGFTHVQLQLETGRTHQIRVHMAQIGHPVLGDLVYGTGKNKFETQNQTILNGQCLHAKTIGFVHPITGESMYFTSELPAYFQLILKKLKGKSKYESEKI